MTHKQSQFKLTYVWVRFRSIFAWYVILELLEELATLRVLCCFTFLAFLDLLSSFGLYFAHTSIFNHSLHPFCFLLLSSLSLDSLCFQVLWSLLFLWFQIDSREFFSNRFILCSCNRNILFSQNVSFWSYLGLNYGSGNKTKIAKSVKLIV